MVHSAHASQTDHPAPVSIPHTYSNAINEIKWSTFSGEVWSNHQLCPIQPDDGHFMQEPAGAVEEDGHGIKGLSLVSVQICIFLDEILPNLLEQFTSVGRDRKYDLQP